MESEFLKSELQLSTKLTIHEQRTIISKFKVSKPQRHVSNPGVYISIYA